MSTCALCNQETDALEPYCGTCGHGRITESLQAPVDRPAWVDQALAAVAMALAFWFTVTVGVAFLREAKALRRARAALELPDPAAAYPWVAPFVAAHPDHPEALFLAGQAAIGTDRPAEALAHFFKLEGMTKNEGAQERAARLADVYRQQIPARAQGVACGQSNYADFHRAYEPLGEPFFESFMSAAAVVARKCVMMDEPQLANEPAFWLIHELGLDTERVVDTLYVEPLGPALQEGELELARRLAIQAVEQLPSAKPRIDGLLQDTRTRVAATLETLESVCSSLRREPAYRQGRSTCFPATAPPAVAEHRDGWGAPLLYSALAASEGSECHPGFSVVSRGADKRVTPGDSSTPAMDITCTYNRWQGDGWARPDRFWSQAK